MSTDTDDKQLSNSNSRSANMRPVCSVSPYLRDKPEVPSTSSIPASPRFTSEASTILAGPRSTPVPIIPTGSRSPSTPSIPTSSEPNSSEPRAESVSVQSSAAPSGTQKSVCPFLKIMRKKLNTFSNRYIFATCCSRPIDYFKQ